MGVTLFPDFENGVNLLSAYEAAKYAVCKHVYFIGNLTASVDPPPEMADLPSIRLHDVVDLFQKWARHYENYQNHHFRIPLQSARNLAPSDQWPLAWALCYAELFLKIGELAEIVIQHRQSSPGPSEERFRLEDSDLEDVRLVRTAMPIFLREFASQVSEEARSPEYKRDWGILKSAIRIGNIPVAFKTLATDVYRRTETAPPKRDTRFHKMIKELGMEPIGLYPSLGKPAVING